jgi:hypothetical protein
VEFWRYGTEDAKLGTATLGPDGTVVIDADEWTTGLLPTVLMSDDYGETFLTPEHGWRYLWALVHTFHSQAITAVLFRGSAD